MSALLTAAEVCDRWHISRRTLGYWIEAVRVSAEEVERVA